MRNIISYHIISNVTLTNLRQMSMSSDIHTNTNTNSKLKSIKLYDSYEDTSEKCHLVSKVISKSV